MQTLKLSPELQHQETLYQEVVKDKSIAVSAWLPSLDLIGQGDYRSFDNPIYEDVFSSSASVQLKQNLFKGFADLNRYQVEKARLDSAKLSVSQERNKIVLEYVQNYLAVLKNRDLLTISKLSLENHNTMYAKIKKKVEVGLGRQLEERHSKSTLDLAKLSLRMQERSSLQGLIRFSKLLEMSLELDQLESVPFNPCLSEELSELLTLTYEKNPAFLIAVKNREVVTQEHEETKKGFLPTLDMTANYYLLNNNPLVSQLNQYDVGLQFNYNIFNGLADLRRQQKQKERIHQKSALIHQSKRDLKNRLELAWFSYKDNIDKYQFNRLNVQSRSDTLRSYDYEFMLGRASLNAMLGATQDYYNALQEMTQTYYELVIDYFRILEAVGIIYEVVGENQSFFSCKNQEEVIYDLHGQQVLAEKEDALKNYFCYKVKPKKLNIRKNPFVEARISGFLIDGTVFCSQHKEKSWIKIEKGWVHEDYVQRIAIQR